MMRVFLLIPLMFLLSACSAVDAVGNKLDDAVARISKRDRELNYVLIQHGVAENPHGLDAEIKRQCHTHIESRIISTYTHPQTWHLFRDLQPMPDATRAYTDRTRYTLPNPDHPEKPYTLEHVVFYMTEYLGEDYTRMGAAKRFVCTVEKNPNGTFLTAVASAEGFRRAMNLPVTPPAGW